MTIVSLPRDQRNMYKCNSLGFEEDEQIAIKVPSGTSRCVQVGGMRTWRAKKQEIFWRGLRNMCLSCAGRSTSEPQRVGDGLLPDPLSRRTYCSPLRECSPGSLLLPAGWAQQQGASWPQFTPLLGHPLPATGGQVCSGLAFNQMETLSWQCSQ